MTLVICQKPSKPTPSTGWVRSGGASTRSLRSEAGARAILALGALELENRSRVRGCAHSNRMRPISARPRPRQSCAMGPDNQRMGHDRLLRHEASQCVPEGRRILRHGTRPNPALCGHTLLPPCRRANPTAWDPNNSALWGHTLLPPCRRANPRAWDPTNPVLWGHTLLPRSRRANPSQKYLKFQHQPMRVN
jgi:hypothetical protein